MNCIRSPLLLFRFCFFFQIKSYQNDSLWSVTIKEFDRDLSCIMQFWFGNRASDLVKIAVAA
jgi:hypothetical protein